MKVKFTIDGEEERFELPDDNINNKYPRGLAEDAAEYIWHSNDGWEWMKEEPPTIEIFVDGDSWGKHEITVDHDPTFHARRVEETDECQEWATSHGGGRWTDI